jgi:hypothetical protein
MGNCTSKATSRYVWVFCFRRALPCLCIVQSSCFPLQLTEKKLTWLADTPDLVAVELVELDYLITVCV